VTDQTGHPARDGAVPRRPSLYRTVLGVAVAAIVAAWLPFSILYIDALTRHATVLAKAGSAPQTVAAGHGQSIRPITTRTS
jgi:hypothetical protein